MKTQSIVNVFDWQPLAGEKVPRLWVEVDSDSLTIARVVDKQFDWRNLKLIAREQYEIPKPWKKSGLGYKSLACGIAASCIPDKELAEYLLSVGMGWLGEPLVGEMASSNMLSHMNIEENFLNIDPEFKRGRAGCTHNRINLDEISLGWIEKSLSAQGADHSPFLAQVEEGDDAYMVFWRLKCYGLDHPGTVGPYLEKCKELAKYRAFDIAEKLGAERGRLLSEQRVPIIERSDLGKDFPVVRRPSCHDGSVMFSRLVHKLREGEPTDVSLELPGVGRAHLLDGRVQLYNQEMGTEVPLVGTPTFGEAALRMGSLYSRADRIREVANNLNTLLRVAETYKRRESP